MFGLFKKAPAEIPHIDKVWKQHTYMLKGMFMMAMNRLQAGQSSLIISFFPDDAEHVQAFMRQHDLPFTVLAPEWQAWQHPAIFIAHASTLQDASMQQHLRHQTTAFAGKVFFPSHHPITKTEQQVLALLSQSGFKQFEFCLSFDEPLMKMFGANNILPLLEKLGLEDTECIEHALVTRSIQTAREKVAAQVSYEKPARSLAEWFSVNVRDDNKGKR